jgi:tRNA(Ile)-lysidine synthase
LALTAAVAWARDHRRGPLAGITVSARVVDHGLQAGSAAVAATAARQAESLGVAAAVVRVAVGAGPGLEAAARTARYAALTAGPPALVLLGHTLDDQAETVLLGLARGSGTRSLAGMPARRDCLVRPFLSVRRTDTEQACRDWGLTPWSDPANADPAYARSRLRAAMGTLEATLGPGLAEGLARTADVCRADADYLDALALPVATSQPTLPVDDLLALAPPVRHRVVLRWLRELGDDAVTQAHVLAVAALVTDWHGQTAITVPGGQVIRVGGSLHRVPRA